ncbi:MAG: hypothetical protein ACLQVY_10335 [Limisphaerales bacterium]
MNIKAPFGFVTGCHAGDKFMVQATLASMRHYCPAVPICLVVDGAFDVSDLESEYGLLVLRVSELRSAEVRKLIEGNPRAKLAAMWEGPFEFYVWMDSDAIVWGDFTSQVRPELDFQIFWSGVSVAADAEEIPSWLPHFYFDPKKLRRFDAEFKWQGRAYFSDGTFACRRNAISFDKWSNAMSWGDKERGPWPAGFHCMPIMNYLVHSMSQRGELRVEFADLQHIWGHHGKEELEQDCAGCGWRFPKEIRRPRVSHFCGRKPFLFDRKAYSHPFTIARLEHHRRRHGNLGAWIAVVNEDCRVLAEKLKHRLNCWCKT